MSNSRWSKWSSGSKEQKLGFSKFLKKHKNNLVATRHQYRNSALKARRLGLVSDGHGAIPDPGTGQVVAKTINGELVFYDRGATGGVASDGEGGNVTVTTPTPTYRDPDTGMVTVPPATPETPEARAQVPDPVPAPHLLLIPITWIRRSPLRTYQRQAARTSRFT